MQIKQVLVFLNTKENNMDVKETKELIAGLLILVKLIEPLKDGVQLADLAKVIEIMNKNPEIMEKVKLAIDGIALVPQELKDLDLQEGIDLGLEILKDLKK